jgi:hypothetical protein
LLRPSFLLLAKYPLTHLLPKLNKNANECTIPVYITTPVPDPICLLDTHRLSRAAKRDDPQDNINGRYELRIELYKEKQKEK